MKIKYQKFILDNFRIINKNTSVVPFKFNKWQQQFLEKMTGRDVILKSRQIGFSSAILAIFATDFLLVPNSTQVVLADNASNAAALLERVKFFLESFEDKNQLRIPLKYNSRYELHNKDNNSKYLIATAENQDALRSRTISNLHLSECAFYTNFDKIIAAALQTVPPNGRIIFETTANGFNEMKEFWQEAEEGKNGFKTHFFGANECYSKEFLKQKEMELKRLYKQEYPSTPEEAFLTSGDCFFDTIAISETLLLNAYDRTKGAKYVPTIS